MQAHVRHDQGADPHADAPAVTSVSGRLCEACGRPLGLRQRSGARFHGGPCRAAGTRARRRAARLDALSRIGAEVAKHRAALRGALAALDGMDEQLVALQQEVEAGQ
jgi:hypothetical protein